MIIVGNKNKGKERKIFQTHKFLLTDTSEVFKEGAEQYTYMFDEHMVDLLEHDDPDLFGFVVEWLYEQRGNGFKPFLWDEEHPSVLVYWNLYYFATRPRMAGLQNHVVRQFHAWRMEKPEAFFEKLEEIMVDKEFRDAAYWDSEASELADFVIDFSVYYDGFVDGLRSLDGKADIYPAKFQHEVFLRFAEGRSARYPSHTALKGWRGQTRREMFRTTWFK